MSRLFLDSNILIYLIEGHQTLGERVASLLENARRRGDTLVTSTFAMGEVLVKPTAEGDTALLAKYETFFGASDLVLVPFGREVATMFAEVRSQNNISSPDAIHLACASWADVALFITHDKRLASKSIPGIGFIVTLDNCPI